LQEKQEESEILHLFSFNRLRFMRFFEDMDDVPCPIDGLIVIPVSDTVEKARTRGESYPGN
jgi:hypothetical protein